MQTKILAALAAAALTPVAALATTGTAHAAPRTQPVGAWDVTVTIDGQSHPSRVSFTSAGKVCLATQVSSGRGHWWRTGARTFRYVIKEEFQPIPGLPGHVLIDQQAVQPGETYTSTGTSRVYDTAGNLISSPVADITATRAAAVPDPGCA
ncbi:hypothetical protein SAMN04489712_102289 [Thermomonospora echinospora]|uniref:Uncharacterized protein n=1 Tax=Thermomonospora echinospora TaxID=1992 RepID=A0A1H5VGN2_9ACTN|nr:hypothetical protein [Thermomonospora echinospora]SEF85677.1 hypothetical protein SAMN04489712_102289 [Thermomonospora echinospora]